MDMLTETARRAQSTVAMHQAEVARYSDRPATEYVDGEEKATPKNLFEWEKRQRAGWTLEWLHQELCVVGGGPRGGPSVLDVGCGDGRLLCGAAKALPDLQATGLDFAPALIERARQRSLDLSVQERVRFELSDLHRVHGTYDAVVALGVIGRQNDPLGFARHLAQFVAPGGSMIVSIANRRSLPRAVREGLGSGWRAMLRIFRYCLPHPWCLRMGNSSPPRLRSLHLAALDTTLSTCGLSRVQLRPTMHGWGWSRSRSWFEDGRASAQVPGVFAQSLWLVYRRQPHEPLE